MFDIQQMFYQVLTNHDDQQAAKCLWRGNQNQAFQDCVRTVHVSGKTTFPCCANWELKHTVLDQKESVSKSIIGAVLHRLYKDYYLDSFNDLASLMQFCINFIMIII